MIWHSLRVVGRGLNSVRWNGYAYIWANLGFLLFSLPIISAPAAYSALFRIAHETQTNPSSADLGLFWETVKANFWKAIPWGLANLVFAFISFTNFLAYRDAPGAAFLLLRVAWLAGVFLWLGVLFYTWAIYYEMVEPTVWGATRNALVMTLRNPLFTLVIVLCILIFAIFSTVLTMMWLLLSWGVIAAIGSAAVLDRLEVFRRSEGRA